MKESVETFKHADHVSWRRVADEIVILDLETSAYFSLNESSAFIWERLGAGASEEDVAAAVCQRYGVKPLDAEKHVKSLIKSLLKAKVLVPHMRTASALSDRDKEIFSGSKGAKKRDYVVPALLALGLLSAPPHAASFGTGDL